VAQAPSAVLLEAHTTAEGGCATRMFPLLAEASTCTPPAAFVHSIFAQRTKLFLPSLAKRKKGKIPKWESVPSAETNRNRPSVVQDSPERSPEYPDTSDVLQTRPTGSKREIYICFQPSPCIRKSGALYKRRAPQSNQAVGALDASDAKWIDSSRFEAKRRPAIGVFVAFEAPQEAF
jgi:hypothetical protein